eukprot:4058687-Pyramimonas_sp.AAC.1
MAQSRETAVSRNDSKPNCATSLKDILSYSCRKRMEALVITRFCVVGSLCDVRSPWHPNPSAGGRAILIQNQFM